MLNWLIYQIEVLYGYGLRVKWFVKTTIYYLVKGVLMTPLIIGIVSTAFAFALLFADTPVFINVIAEDLGFKFVTILPFMGMMVFLLIIFELIRQQLKNLNIRGLVQFFESANIKDSRRRKRSKSHGKAQIIISSIGLTIMTGFLIVIAYLGQSVSNEGLMKKTNKKIMKSYNTNAKVKFNKSKISYLQKLVRIDKSMKRTKLTSGNKRAKLKAVKDIRKNTRLINSYKSKNIKIMATTTDTEVQKQGFMEIVYICFIIFIEILMMWSFGMDTVSFVYGTNEIRSDIKKKYRSIDKVIYRSLINAPQLGYIPTPVRIVSKKVPKTKQNTSSSFDKSAKQSNDFDKTASNDNDSYSDDWSDDFGRFDEFSKSPDDFKFGGKTS